MFQQFIDILPWLGDAFSYVLAIGEMPLEGVRFLLNGNSYIWFVTNIFTGEVGPITIPSYDVLLDFLINSNFAFVSALGDIIKGVFSTLGDFIYTLIFPRTDYFGIAWDYVPLYLGLPVMIIRVSVFTFAIRMVLKVIGGVVDIAS